MLCTEGADEVQLIEASHDSHYQLGTVLCDKYKLLEELGAGGFGRVYLAQHVHLGTKVALKVGHSKDNPSALVKEARLAAGLSSPHSVRIFDVDKAADGRPYIVMEYLQGCTLREYLAQKGHVSPAMTVRWGLEICAALSEAHLRGLIHRDIKPSNLFLVPTWTGQLHVKLVDFGLAKTLDNNEDSATDSGVVAGTPAYMAPERLRSNETTAATDIWSLGVVLFEMLTRTTPFEGRTNTAMLAAIIADPPRSPGDLRPGLPANLEAVIIRCLRKCPNERYTTVERVAEALSACLEDAPYDVAAATSVRPLEQPRGSDMTASIPSHPRRGSALRPALATAAVGLGVAWFIVQGVMAAQYSEGKGQAGDGARASRSQLPPAAHAASAGAPPAASRSLSSPDSPPAGRRAAAGANVYPGTAFPSTTPDSTRTPTALSDADHTSLPPALVTAKPSAHQNDRTRSQRARQLTPARSSPAPSAPQSSTPNGLIMRPDF